MGEVVAGAAEFFGGMLALCLVMAAAFVLTLLISVANYLHIGAIPFVGGAIMAALRFVGAALDNLAGWLWQHANPVNLAVATFGYLGNSLSLGMTSVIGAQYSATSRVVNTSIPNAINTAIARATALYYAGVAWTDARYASAVLLADTLYNDALHAIGLAQSAAMSYADGRYSAALTEINAAKAAVTAGTLGLVQSLQGWVVQQLDQLRGDVQSTDAARGETTQGQIGDAVRGVEGDIAKAGAAAVAVGAAAAAAFNAWRQQCGDPLCNNLNGFGNEIASILGLISDGALVALIAEAATHPQAAADFVKNDIAGPAGDALNTVAGLVGVKLAA
jgi:hypothetical protein